MNINTSGITYSITIDPTQQQHKPSKKQMGIITNHLNLVTGLTINEFATYSTSPYSYSWSGGLFNGKICNANWYQQSVFALDFDKGLISIDEALKRLNELEIFPQLWYSTFSDSSAFRKFRIIFFVDEPVENEALRKLITTSLLGLFPEADKQCKNAGRIFLGGKEAHVINQQPIHLKRLIDILSIELIAKDGGRTRKINNALLESSMKTGTKQALLYNNYRNVHSVPDSNNKLTTSIEGGEVIDFDVARQRVKIFDEFLKGKWLHHDQLFGLATNLYYIRGGRSLMNTTMKYYNDLNQTHYTENNFNILTYLKKVSYPPIPIHSFSPYKEDNDFHDLISATKDQRGHIEQIEPIVRMSLGEAETLFLDRFTEVMDDSTTDKIHLFILPTAIGKTEAILSAKATIAAPTNSLKDEIGNRMKVEYVTTPDAVVFENSSINRKLDYYYSIGLPKKATAVLYDVVSEKNSWKYSNNDIIQADEYLSKLKSSYFSTNTILTTHARAIHSDFSHDTIIFDEDPLTSLIDIKQVSISDIQKLDNQTRLDNNDLNNIINYLKSTIPSEITATPLFAVDIDALVDKVTVSSIQTNIFDFFNSSYLMKDEQNYDVIHYVVKRQLPKNKKIIILSATLPIYIYQKLYGDRLNVIDIRDVEQQGQIIQYTNRSCSRNSLQRYVSDISQTVGDKPVITFKSFQHHFNNPVDDMYFGNCSGYDNLKGKDIAVVGTPHRDNIQYLLTAKVLRIDFKTIDTTMSFQKIEYNGFKFKFNTYDNEELRNIQLAFIESDLIQAVGRARTLRTDATVEVCSNFPLRMSNRFIY
ncbi:MAG: hypothetical protein J0I09_10500 [Sphingobacteriia bacterium]|nr:hypothetical protein [Sphingobacteriia bacterium]